MSEHIGELAESYAVGALGDAERERVDRHAQECSSCAAELGVAEATLAAMVVSADAPVSLDRRMSAAFVRRQTFLRSALVAAAFAIGLLPGLALWFGERSARGFDADRQVALAAMVSSHFAHAQFVPEPHVALKAKIVYARTGAWIYAIAETNQRLTLEAVRGGGTVPLGPLYVSGHAAELFVANPGARKFVLKDPGGRILATCTTELSRAVNPSNATGSKTQ